jgi:hypothetical protein
MLNMTTIYRRPTGPLSLDLAPQLASWDRAGHPAQLRLADFLAHVDAVTAPVVAGTSGPLVVELVVGLPPDVPLIGGGRDLDNFLYPVAQRLGPARLAAVFGRKIHGPSSIAIGPAETAPADSTARFTTRLGGSYARKQWKQTLHDQLRQDRVELLPPGPVKLDIAVTTGPARNWGHLWKPLIDAFGPVLGENPHHAFHPFDDRIVDLGLHHSVANDLGHDVVIDAWWTAG